jgi:hypothetical protein
VEFYDKIEEVYEATGRKVVIDSAFTLGKRGYSIKSVQQDPMDAQELLTNRDTTSVSGECGGRLMPNSLVLS